MNFNKEGYSTDETAQILHCCKVTVMNLINTGELGANIYPKEKVQGKKRRIRITRKHIQDYMRSHQSKFSKEDLDAWKVFEEKPIPKPEVHEAYEAHSLDELTGAWAGLAEQNKQEMLLLKLLRQNVLPSASALTGVLLLETLSQALLPRSLTPCCRITISPIMRLLLRKESVTNENN